MTTHLLTTKHARICSEYGIPPSVSHQVKHQHRLLGLTLRH